MIKMLVVDPQKCTGCRICEIVCAVNKEGVSNPSRARVAVVRWEDISLEMPMVCQQCEAPVCQSICPVNAISRDEELGRVMVNYDLCVGCKMCVATCPFGGMGFDAIKKKVVKCDLCDGDPICARYCTTGALQYVEISNINLHRKREATEHFSELIDRYIQTGRVG